MESYLYVDYVDSSTAYSMTLTSTKLLIERELSIESRGPNLWKIIKHWLSWHLEEPQTYVKQAVGDRWVMARPIVAEKKKTKLFNSDKNQQPVPITNFFLKKKGRDRIVCIFCVYWFCFMFYFLCFNKKCDVCISS